MASSFKAILAAAVLACSLQTEGLMQRVVRYTERDLITYSPIVARHVAQGMTVADLCAARIRARVPAGWAVGDKTGTGAHGAASDIGVVWPPGRAPLVVVIDTWHEAADAKAREDVIAQATRIVVGAFKAR